MVYIKYKVFSAMSEILYSSMERSRWLNKTLMMSLTYEDVIGRPKKF